MSINVKFPETLEQLTALAERIQAGEELVLTKEGIAIARLIPTQPRIPGQDKGKVVIASDFNDPLPDDVLNDFLNPA